MRKVCMLICAFLIFPIVNISAQTTINPDISAIGQILMYSHNDRERVNEYRKFNLSNPSMEISINGYLNPFVRADAIIAWEGEENASMEEFYATVLRGLPLGMNLRAGKHRLEFGRLNPLHPHTYSFIDLPLVHEAFFGEEGLNDMNLRASFLLPTGSAYTELMGAITKGEALLAEDALQDNDTTHIGLGVFSRLTTSFAVSENSELSLGTSVFNGVYTLEPSQLRTTLIGADVKYKNVRSRYSTLLFEGEVIHRSQEQETGKNINSIGEYAYLDYKFNKIYNIGGMFDNVSEKSVEYDTFGTPTETTIRTWRGTLFVGFAPIEETSLVRLVGHWTKPEDTSGIWELKLQFVFSLGPHKPHNF